MMLRTPKLRQRGFIINPYVYGSGAGTPTFTFSNAKLLLHGNSRPFIDVSTAKKPVSNQKAGCTLSSSNILTGQSYAALMVPGSDTDWQFGTGAWFVSAKINANLAAAAGRIFDTRPSSGSSNGWAVVVNQTTRVPVIIIEGTTYGSGTPAANLLVTDSADTAVAFSYDGTDLRCFINGALSWTHTVSLNIDTGSLLIVGNSPTLNDANTTAKLREVLVVKGESVVTATYGDPASWTDTGITIEGWNPATYSNVKLNCHMSGANGGTTFTDTSASAKTVTPNGNVQTSTAQARIGSSSALFDGTGDYLTLADSADWDFAGDFALEVQIRPDVTTRLCVYSNYGSTTTGWTLQVNLTNAGRIHFNVSGDGSEIDSDPYHPVAANTWVHLMAARFGAYLGLFVEGELVVIAADATSTSSTTGLYIGRLTTVLTTIDFDGHMQELRIVKGEAPGRSFVVQTAAHPDS